MKRSGGPIDRHIGERVRKRRDELKLTQSAIGEKVGVRYQQIQKYEDGADRISAATLYDLAIALHVDVSFFFSGWAAKAILQFGLSESLSKRNIPPKIQFPIWKSEN